MNTLKKDTKCRNNYSEKKEALIELPGGKNEHRQDDERLSFKRNEKSRM